MVAVGERRFRGRAIDLGGSGVGAAAVERAIRRDDASAGTSRPRDGEETVRVDCPSPGAVHERVGVIRPEMTVGLTGALAAAARTRGHSAPEERTLRAARERLADLSRPDVDLTAVRRRAATAGESERRLEERVATLRGRVQTLREQDRPAATDAEAALADAVRELTDVETARHAARQRLRQAESAAREARDARERRMRAEDRVGNLERSVRRSLAASVHGAFAAAVERLPGEGTAGEDPESYEGDDVTAALAVVRVARVAAPVVLDVRRFGSAGEAATRLRAPVIRT